jgi:hypothetical protein
VIEHLLRHALMPHPLLQVTYVNIVPGKQATITALNGAKLVANETGVYNLDGSGNATALIAKFYVYAKAIGTGRQGSYTDL